MSRIKNEIYNKNLEDVSKESKLNVKNTQVTQVRIFVDVYTATAYYFSLSDNRRIDYNIFRK